MSLHCAYFNLVDNIARRFTYAQTCAEINRNKGKQLPISTCLSEHNGAPVMSAREGKAFTFIPSPDSLENRGNAGEWKTARRHNNAYFSSRLKQRKGSAEKLISSTAMSNSYQCCVRGHDSYRVSREQ